MEFHPTANLVEYLFAPASIEEELEQKANMISKEIADKLGIVGLLAVEMFLDVDGDIIVNEMAPRPHNSGHFSIEGCVTSQFMQLIRILLGLQLGSTELLMPSVMINLLGEDGYVGLVRYDGIKEAINTDGVHVHLYGKTITKPNRKMGHITVINHDLDKAKSCARKIKETIKVIA
jgi:5-(carboxyamino)imidazole ribonucleotide synthase